MNEMEGENKCVFFFVFAVFFTDNLSLSNLYLQLTNVSKLKTDINC